MALGNRKDSHGSKQSSFAYEKGTLRVLNKILESFPPLGTETTLQAILAAIVAQDQDLEIMLVRDTVTETVYQQITNWEEGTPTVTYKDVNGNPFTPTNPIEYLDPSAVMNLVLTELLDQGLSLDALVAWITSGPQNSIDSAPVVLSIEQQAILEAIKTATEQLDPDVRTHTVLTPAGGALDIPAGTIMGSFLNRGPGIATFNGQPVYPGMTIPWGRVGQRDTYGEIPYNTNGNGVTIEYTT